MKHQKNKRSKSQLTDKVRYDNRYYLALLKECMENRNINDIDLKTKKQILDSIKKETEKRKPLKIHSNTNATTIMQVIEK